MLIAAAWPERAFIRAQLIEDGYEVVALDAWPMPREYRQPDTLPRVLVIDLNDLPKPQETLDEVRVVLPPERVVVITALGSLPPGDITRRGFHVVPRPATVGQIVAAVGAALTRAADPI